MVTPKMVSVIVFTAIRALVYRPFQQMQEVSAKHDVPPRPVEIVVTQPAALPILLEPRLIHRACRDASGMSGWKGRACWMVRRYWGGEARRGGPLAEGTWGAEALVSINKSCVCRLTPFTFQYSNTEHLVCARGQLF